MRHLRLLSRAVCLDNLTGQIGSEQPGAPLEVSGRRCRAGMGRRKKRLAGGGTSETGQEEGFYVARCQARDETMTQS
jgi:hypothetical protein